MTKDCNYYARKLGEYNTIHAALQIVGNTLSSNDFLRRLNLLLPEHQRKLFFQNIPAKALAAWMSNPPISNSIFETMNELDLLPMPTIITENRSGLEKAITDIRSGGFDRQNSLHLEIEFSRYKIRGPPGPKRSISLNLDGYLTFTEFRELPWIDGSVILDDDMLKGIKLLAAEAVAVHEYINRNKRDFPVMVIGNKRYGTNWVVDPLKEHLVSQDIFIANDYVRSFDFENKYRKLGYIKPEIWQWIAAHNPDIFIVDGAGHNKEEVDGQIFARFPGAMWGYLNDFVIYNLLAGEQEIGEEFSAETRKYAAELKKHNPSHPYEFLFWAPNITERFLVGQFECSISHAALTIDKTVPDRQLHIINSVNNSCGFLDDHDEKVESFTLGFKSNGLSYTTVAPDEKSFVKKVQEVMRGYIREELNK